MELAEHKYQMCHRLKKFSISNSVVEWTRLYMSSMCFMSRKIYVNDLKVKSMTNDIIPMLGRLLVYVIMSPHLAFCLLYWLSPRPKAEK